MLRLRNLSCQAYGDVIMALQKPANQQLRLNSHSGEVRTSSVFIIRASDGRAEFVEQLNAK